MGEWKINKDNSKYELWARNRETNIYRYIYIPNFNSEEMFDMALDKVDREKYSRAMIINTKTNEQEASQDFDKYIERPKVLSKHL